MILVDTSVWIEHLRGVETRLGSHLEEGRALVHPFVVGEMACGNLRNREEVLRHLDNLPQVPVASHSEVLRLIEERKLMGRGIGFIDAHLLAATLLAPGARLWTLDRNLAGVAADLDVALA